MEKVSSEFKSVVRIHHDPGRTDARGRRYASLSNPGDSVFWFITVSVQALQSSPKGAILFL